MRVCVLLRRSSRSAGLRPLSAVRLGAVGERARIGEAAQLALAHPRGVASGRKKEEGIPPAEAAHHDVSADHPEAAW